MRYNCASLNDSSPPDVMPLNWHNLTLDEQFFQSVLSAAFTIQEHNDWRQLACQTLARQTQAEPETEGPRAGVPPLDAERRPLAQAPRDSAVLSVPVAKDDAKETIGQEKIETIHDRAFDTSAPDQTEGKTQWITDAPTDASIDASGASAELLNCVPNHLLREIVQQALQATHATGAAIALKQQGELICRAVAGDFASEIGKMINTGSGFTGTCTSSGTMQVCSNTALDSRVDADACRKLGVSAIIVVPLLHQDQLLGLIAVFSQRPYAFGVRALQALQDLVEKFAANLQLSAESANANTDRKSPGAFNFPV